MQMPREMNDFVYDLITGSQNLELDKSTRLEMSRAARIVEGLYRERDDYDTDAQKGCLDC